MKILCLFCFPRICLTAFLLIQNISTVFKSVCLHAILSQFFTIFRLHHFLFSSWACIPNGYKHFKPCPHEILLFECLETCFQTCFASKFVSVIDNLVFCTTSSVILIFPFSLWFHYPNLHHVVVIILVNDFIIISFLRISLTPPHIQKCFPIHLEQFPILSVLTSFICCDLHVLLASFDIILYIISGKFI